MVQGSFFDKKIVSSANKHINTRKSVTEMQLELEMKSLFRGSIAIKKGAKAPFNELRPEYALAFN